jgi:hypothetical protein
MKKALTIAIVVTMILAGGELNAQMVNIPLPAGPVVPVPIPVGAGQGIIQGILAGAGAVLPPGAVAVANGLQAVAAPALPPAPVAPPACPPAPQVGVTCTCTFYADNDLPPYANGDAAGYCLVQMTWNPDLGFERLALGGAGNNGESPGMAVYSSNLCMNACNNLLPNNICQFAGRVN